MDTQSPLHRFHCRSVEPNPVVGSGDLHGGCVVDLSKPETIHLVRGLYYSKFSRRVRAAGIDADDMLQEIYQGILIRNKGTCPFDENKGALSTYLHWVMRGIILNAVDKRRRKEWQVLGQAADIAEQSESRQLPPLFEQDEIREGVEIETRLDNLRLMRDVKKKRRYLAIRRKNRKTGVRRKAA